MCLTISIYVYPLCQYTRIQSKIAIQNDGNNSQLFANGDKCDKIHDVIVVKHHIIVSIN
jgi:hypothetical protein